MKTSKNRVPDAVKILGKVCSVTSPVEFQRAIWFVGMGQNAVVMATDDVEVVSLAVEVEAKGAFDFCVEVKALRELMRTVKSEVEIQGVALQWPEIVVVPTDAVTVALPEEFGKLLALAVPVVNLREAQRRVIDFLKVVPDQPPFHAEEPKMKAVKPIEVSELVNVMDELNAAIDDMRGKLKILFDESVPLTRKAIEWIKMAI